MTARNGKLIGARPRGAAERWIDAGLDREPTTPRAETFSARLTIDITPALRGRIKVIAFERGVTVADMLRALLEEQFGQSSGGAGQVTP